MNSESRESNQLELGNLDQLTVLEPVVMQVPLVDLPTNITAPTPTREMVASVKRWGLFQPVILVEADNGYHIADGRGRILASRMAERETVRAEVYPKGTLTAVITLITSKQKRRNPAADLEAIQELLAEMIRSGVNEQELYDNLYTATGLNRKEIDKVLRLGKLHPILLEGLKAGQIKPSIAEAIARMSPDDMEALVTVFLSEGKLQTKHLEDLRSVNLQDALDRMPELFPIEKPDWRSQAGKLVDQLIQVVPEDRRGAVEALRQQLIELQEVG